MATFADRGGLMYQAAARRQWDIHRVWIGRGVSGYVDTVLDPEVATTIARLDREVEERKERDDMAEMGEWPVHRAVLRGAHTCEAGIPGACNRCLDERPPASEPAPGSGRGGRGKHHERHGA